MFSALQQGPRLGASDWHNISSPKTSGDHESPDHFRKELSPFGIRRTLFRLIVLHFECPDISLLSAF